MSSNFFSEFDKFVMGHANITNLIHLNMSSVVCKHCGLGQIYRQCLLDTTGWPWVCAMLALVYTSTVQ